jgi:hypothetical protein
VLINLLLKDATRCATSRVQHKTRLSLVCSAISASSFLLRLLFSSAFLHHETKTFAMSRMSKESTPWPRYLWIAPLLAGTSWILTLTVMLFYWVAKGRPRLPMQSNPYVAFISDIGAFALQPFFIGGCTLTSLSFGLTVYAVHYARYSPYLYRISDDVRWRKVCSASAMICGLAASTALLLLSIFDTYEYHSMHATILMVCFGGLALCMVFTTAVWWDHTWWVRNEEGLRKWCLVSNALVAVQLCFTIAFVSFMWTNHMRVAGILEWIMTYTGAVYLLTFIGYLR